MINPESNVLLHMSNISKRFPGNKVLDSVDLTVRSGKVTALMGENGAGKSTLMKILNGIYSLDEGSILYKGKPLHLTCPRDAINNGIAMIHQELSPVLDMKVYENIFLGRELMKPMFSVVNKKAMKEKAKVMLDNIGVRINPDEKMRNLSVSEMQMVEIVKAISINAEVIVMDEPTSAITEKEVVKLFDVIRRLKDKNCGIIYISHKMDEIFKIADDICILRDGQHIATKPAAELDHDKLITLMVGRELNEVYPKFESVKGEAILKVDSLSRSGKFENISFEVRRGEIFGFAGLVGAGRTEVMEAIFGINPASSGTISIRDKTVKIKNTKQSIRSNIAMVTEDRRLTGLNLIACIKDNMSIVNLKDYCKFGSVIEAGKEKTTSDQLIKQYNVKTTSRNKLVGQLSGGNQQKVALAKWLSWDPEIIILDEPTRGIDVGAKAEIYKRMADLSKEGKAIIMVSSEMSELFGMCDRILVMSNGKQKGIFQRSEFNQEKILSCASGKSKEELT